MNINKRILILPIFILLNLFVVKVILAEVTITDTKSIKLNNKESSKSSKSERNERDDEIGKMLDILWKERKELDKLKEKYNEISQSKENIREKVVGNGKNSVKVDENKTEDRVITANAKGSDESKNKAVLKDDINKDEEIKVTVKKDEEIIHPFEIAENLYSLGEYETALDIYELVNKEELDDDKKSWVSYQIANCYRKLGLFEEAIDTYKKIEIENEGTYWAKQAQWYIENIEWRADVKDKLETVVK